MKKLIPALTVLLSLSVNVAAFAMSDDTVDGGIEIAAIQPFALQSLACSKDKGEGGEGDEGEGLSAELRYVANHHEDHKDDKTSEKPAEGKACSHDKHHAYGHDGAGHHPEHAHADHHEDHSHDAHHAYDHDDAGHHENHEHAEHHEDHVDAEHHED